MQIPVNMFIKLSRIIIDYLTKSLVSEWSETFGILLNINLKFEQCGFTIE